MNRKEFISQSAKATVSLAAPFILPSGRLFAPTGKRIANHVVLCLFAGGVRNRESVYMNDGNLMPNTLKGIHAVSKDIQGGMTNLPLVSPIPLQQYGTLFKEFRFKEGPTAHVSGHLTTLTGKYFLNGHNPKKRSPYPTIFEYYRKHSDPRKSALNAWWIAERNDPFNICNYSEHPNYGVAFGANYFHPKVLLSEASKNYLGSDELKDKLNDDRINSIRNLLNDELGTRGNFVQPQLGNSRSDRVQIDAFIKQCAKESGEGKYEDPYGIGKSAMNEDLYNIFFAEKTLSHFKPELLIVNMMGIDRGHTDFTLYCDNMRKADFALAKLWQGIQSNPELKDDTILIAAPEHGRNLMPNTLKDKYGRYALDHTSDATSREIFCLIMGTKNKVAQAQVINHPMGESIDIAATISYILGFDHEVKSLLGGKFLDAAFV